MKKISILYHANCFDGFGGAYVAWKKFGNNADYFPVEHQTPPLKNLKNKEIFMIDFCYPDFVLEELRQKNKKIVVLDHHISAYKNIKKADEYVFDNNHSGAIIAWNYFFNKTKPSKLLLHIEDQDLWNFKLPFTKEILSVLELQKFDFKVWDQFSHLLNNKLQSKKIISLGKEILKYKDILVNKITLNAEPIFLAGYKALSVNSPILVSEISAKLLKQSPLVVIWQKITNGYNISLRSKGKIDVSKIAMQYNGGGHKHSAGFKIKKLPW
ncbi:MAG: DHHA1 domain-containing protein [Minisyncoccia bacterium]